jgi:DNA (cytosine-5)-methyltransferase 1
MSHVDLCSGIGGFALGFEWAGLSKPVLFCDIEPWSRKVLAKHWPDVPIAVDVKELANDPDRFIPRTDPRNTILSSGYPCQPFSVAGKQRGTEDPRHIYPCISKIIAHKRPAFVVLENVFGHLSLGLDEVLNDLANKDYAARAFIFPSGAIVGAPHHRNRIFIIARNVGNSEHDGSSAATVSGKHGQDEAGCAERQIASKQSEGASEPGHDANVGNAGCVTKGQWSVEGHRLADTSENVADTDNEGSQGEIRGWQTGAQRTPHRHSAKCDSNVADTTSQRQQRQGSSRDASNSTQRGEGQATEFINGGFGDKRQLESRMGDLVDGLPKGLDRFDGWEREPADIPRVATGVKDRKNRLMGLGNAIVPSIAMQIGLTIKAVRDA